MDSKWRVHAQNVEARVPQFLVGVNVRAVVVWAGYVNETRSTSKFLPVSVFLSHTRYPLANMDMAGIEEGTLIRVKEAGDASMSPNGPNGDLFVRIAVSPSSTFTRQGANLYYQAKLPFHRALLGGVVRVPTLDGDVDVRIPGGTQQGEEMVLRGRGVSYLNNPGCGDLFVKFALQLPRYGSVLHFCGWRSLIRLLDRCHQSRGSSWRHMLLMWRRYRPRKGTQSRRERLCRLITVRFTLVIVSNRSALGCREACNSSRRALGCNGMLSIAKFCGIVFSCAYFC